MAPRYDVREVLDRGHYWQVVYDVTWDNGFTTEHGHSIPKDTLEWRAAEYDLHPVNDLETILDIVVSEPFIAPEDVVPGESLHDAPDITTARQRHVARCARAKLKCRISTRKNTNGSRVAAEPANPFDLIRTTAVMDELVIAIKKEHVREARQEAKDRREESDQDRAERLAVEMNVDLHQVLKGMKNSG